MKHENFYGLYKEVRNKEVAALKEALQRFPQHQYEWTDKQTRPKVVAIPIHYSFSKDYDVCRVTDKISSDEGIFIQDTDTNAILQVGFISIPFDTIEYLIECLPEID